MDQLWAPWRSPYVSQPPAQQAPGCFICAALAASDDKANLVAVRTPRSVVMLNLFPYNNGHLLVAPLAHKGHLHQLDSAELLEIMETTRRMVGLLEELLKPEGF